MTCLNNYRRLWRTLCSFVLAAVTCYPLVFAQGGTEEGAKQLIVMVNGTMNGVPTIGAGIIVGHAANRLYIATANHVVRQDLSRAEDLKVSFSGLPGESFPAMMADNEFENLDLAVLIVPDVIGTALSVESIPFGSLGDSNTLQKGDKINSMGQDGGKRWFAPLNLLFFERQRDLLLVQSSANNRGASGGGLFTEDWQLIGMVISHELPTIQAISIETIIPELNFAGFPINLIASESAQPTTEANPTPEPASASATAQQTATLVVTSAHEFADVYVNGVYQDTLLGGRLELALAGGEITLLIRKEGYNDFAQQVTLIAGQSQEVPVTLTTIQAVAPSTTPEVASQPATSETLQATETASTPQVNPTTGLDFHLGTFNNGGKAETLAVCQVLDPATAPKELLLTGPATWNGGQPLTISVDTSQPFYHFGGVTAEAGDYSAANQEGEFSKSLTLTPQLLDVAKELVGEAATSSAFWDVSTRWAAVTGAVSYEVSIEQLRSNRNNKVIKVEGTTRTEKRFTSLTLERNNDYVMCVEAMNWDASQPLPTEASWQPQVSRVCQDITFGESTDDDGGGGSSGGGGSGLCGGVPCN